MFFVQKTRLFSWGSRDFFFPILGSLGRARDFRERGPEGNFGQKAVRAQRFFSRFSGKTRKFGENVKIDVLLKREHHFQDPRRAKYGPLGHPGAPIMTPGRARNRKRRKRNTLVSFCLSRVAPAAVIFPWSSILGVFLGSPGGTRQKNGSPPEPENVSGIVLRTPFGRRRGFRVHFGSIWGRFGVDFGSIFGRVNSKKNGQKSKKKERKSKKRVKSLIGATMEHSIDR